MKDFKNEKFRHIWDTLNEVELHTMEQEDYLELNEQLEINTEEILKLLPVEQQETVKALLNARTEIYMGEYNLLAKNLVITKIGFEDSEI